MSVVVPAVALALHTLFLLLTYLAIGFLLLDSIFPRSAAHCLLQIDEALETLGKLHGSTFDRMGTEDPARRIVGRALASLRRQGLPAQLYIVGQDKEAGFRRQAASLGMTGQVHFLVGRDDVPDLLLAADALVHPALDEAAGIVLMALPKFIEL